MLGALIEGNLAAHPERAGLLRRPGSVGVELTDVGVAVTVRLTPGEVRLANGLPSRPTVRIRAESSALLEMSGTPRRFGVPDLTRPEGRAVVGRLVRGQLRIRGLLRGAAVLARFGALTSVG